MANRLTFDNILKYKDKATGRPLDGGTHFA